MGRRFEVEVSSQLKGITFFKRTLKQVCLHSFVCSRCTHSFFTSSFCLVASLFVLFQPSSATSLDSYTVTSDYLILVVLEDVKTKVSFWKYSEKSSKWSLSDEESGVVSCFLFSLSLAHNFLPQLPEFVDYPFLLMTNMNQINTG
jgi:prolyl oligopeptidase PreP (S9A serine peptidase family)